MKVLIADDEYHVVEAVLLLVPWIELGISKVLTASSVSESIEIIKKEKPEIIIIDIIMGDETGIDLMNFIKKEFPSIKAIAISGHNDFEYVRKMLTNGSIDYLLKPLEADTLINAVSRAIDAWNKDYKKNIGDKHMLQQYSGTLLSKMVKGEVFSEAYRDLVGIDAIFESVKTCTLLFYDINYLPVGHSYFTELLSQFEKEILNYLTSGMAGTIFHNLYNPNEVIILMFKEADDSVKDIQKIITKLFYKHELPFHMGRSATLSFPSQFKFSFLQAKDAFFNIDCTKVPEYIVTYNSDSKEIHNISAHDLENKILSMLLTGHYNKIERDVSQWLDSLFIYEAVSLYYIQNICNIIQTSLSNWVTQLKSWFPEFNHVCAEPSITYNKLVNEKYLFSPELLKTAIVSEILYLLDELKQISNSSNVFQRIAYHIELNYRQHFNQSEYAKMFYLNKDYMCRKFKKTFNVSMVSYLNQVRIEQAKKLIQNSNIRFRDIAFHVGFEDEKYFIKQFKRLTAMTPSEYRSSLEKDIIKAEKHPD